jgi:hypothetical protein
MTRKSPIRAAAFVFTAALGLCFPGYAAPLCDVSPATSWYTTITAGNYRLLFDDESGPGPDMVERPLHGYAFVTDTDSFRIAGPHGTCWASPEVGIVTMPVFIGMARYLYIPTYSGGDAYLFVVDAQTCKTLWRSPDMEGGTPVRERYGFFLPGAGQVFIEPNCLPRPVAP